MNLYEWIVAITSTWAIIMTIVAIIRAKYKLPPLATKIIDLVDKYVDKGAEWFEEAKDLKTDDQRKNFVAKKLQEFAKGFGYELGAQVANLIVEFLYNKYKSVTTK